MGPKLDNFVHKSLFLVQASPFFSKILVPRLNVFNASNRFSDYGPQTKRAEKRNRPYNVSFFRHEYRIFEIAGNFYP